MTEKKALKKLKNARITITLTQEMASQFRTYCGEKHRTVSGQLQLMIENELKKTKAQ